VHTHTHTHIHTYTHTHRLTRPLADGWSAFDGAYLKVTRRSDIQEHNDTHARADFKIDLILPRLSPEEHQELVRRAQERKGGLDFDAALRQLSVILVDSSAENPYAESIEGLSWDEMQQVMQEYDRHQASTEMSSVSYHDTDLSTGESVACASADSIKSNNESSSVVVAVFQQMKQIER